MSSCRGRENACYGALLAACSALVGYFSLTSGARWPVLMLSVPVLWTLAPSRTAAFWVAFAYTLAVSRGLAPGAAVFLSETHTAADGIVLWILMSLGPSVPFFAFWHGGRLGRCLGFLAANLAAFLLPPLALVGIMAPWMGTGCLFPGWGWWGLLALMGIYFACALFRPFACGFLLLLLLLGCLGWAELKPPTLPEGFMAVDTSFGRMGSGSFDFRNDFERARMVFRRLNELNVASSDAEYVVLPETIAGRLNATGLALWHRELRPLLRSGQKVLLGAELPTEDGRRYDNVVLLLGDDAVLSVRQRIPVPYSMYRPFSGTGANLHLFDEPSGILRLPDGRKAAAIVCYEGHLSLPCLLSFLHSPDLLLWVGNQWWCRDTSLPRIQERSVGLWAQLFGVPVAASQNR